LTDDSEMALSMADGLIEVKDSLKVEANFLAKHYGVWFNSPPFDIGRTTRFALQSLGKYYKLEDFKLEELKENKFA
jgi:ADP-ribosylglycohydrolase